MKFENVVGIDVAKETFVVAIYQSSFLEEFKNQPKDIRRMVKCIKQQLSSSLTNCLFCLEHTGLYSFQLVVELQKQGLPFAVISGLELKRSRGLQRGKSDPMDASQIAEYAARRQDRIRLSKLPSDTLLRLQQLLSLRAMHIRHKAAYQMRLKEQFSVMKKTHLPKIYHSQKRSLRHLTNEIKIIEKQIEEEIRNDERVFQQYQLLTSVKGVGMIVASYMLVKTKCFTAFTDWRKFACYCGTAPFPNQSGKQNRPYRISKIGDKNMKTLLTLAARVAMQHDAEIKAFYRRKLDQGKTSKCVQNAIRNKLLARMFSVIKRGTPYVEMMKHAS